MTGKARFGSALSLCVALLAGGAPAHAARATLTATVDRNQARVGEQIRLDVTIEGTTGVSPTLPELPDFAVYRQGPTTRMTVVNGRMSSSVVHSYVLVAAKEGAFTVGPITAQVDGETLASRPFTLRILAADAEPKEAQSFFLWANVDQPRPFVGQPVVYALRFYNRAQLANGSLSEPEMGTLVKQSLGDKRSYEATVGGVAYQVTEFRWAVTAQQPGRFTIPPASVTAEVVVQRRRQRPQPLDGFLDDPFADFFGRRETQTKVVRSAAVELEVRPLPEPPAGFTGLVGSFTVAASLSQRQVRVGESVTLTVEIFGTGNAAAIGEPTVGGLESFKVYDDKPVVEANTDWSGPRGRKTFKRALVPQQAGEVTLPPVTVTYFDPQAEAYRTARSPALALSVLPAAGEEELRLTEMIAPAGGKVAVQVLADDLLPIHRQLDALTAHGFSGAARTAFAAALLLPALGFVGLSTWQRRQERRRTDVAGRRAREARRAARAVARQASRKGRAAEEALTLAARALCGYVGDKLNREGGALTAAELAAELTALGVDAALVTEARALVERADAWRYGAVGEATAGDPGRAAMAIIDRLEVALRSARRGGARR